MEFLTTAMDLSPCAHKISEAALEQLRGTLSHGFPCPLCRRLVERYSPDLAYRGIVQSFLALTSSDIPQLVAEIAEETTSSRRVPYPGDKAKFVLDSYAWCVARTGDQSIRHMRFRPETENTFFEAIMLVGYEDGKMVLKIIVKTKKNLELFRTFLLNVGLSSKGCGFSGPQELKEILRILTENNQFDAGDWGRLQKLALSGDWRTITPLTSREKRFLEGSVDIEPDPGWE